VDLLFNINYQYNISYSSWSKKRQRQLNSCCVAINATQALQQKDRCLCNSMQGNNNCKETNNPGKDDSSRCLDLCNHSSKEYNKISRRLDR
jgi:hypothetical protein